MGKLVVVVLVLLGAFLIWFNDPTVQQGRESAYWNRQAREAMALEREQQRIDAQMSVDAVAVPVMQIVVLAVASTLVIGIPALLGVGAVAFFRRRHSLVYPDAAGRLPVRLADSEYQRIAAVALAAYHDTQHERAHQSRAVPITYAPHTSISEQSHAEFSTADSTSDAAVQSADGSLPGLTDLADMGFTPTRDAILLGIGAGNERITVPAKALWHIGMAGSTGRGKSNVARLLVAQALKIGAKVSIADPKWTPYDVEADEDWRPIAARLHLPPAQKSEDIKDVLAWHVEEIRRRRDLRTAQKHPGAPLFLYLDEWHVIVDDVEGAEEAMKTISRIGRALNVFLLTATHSMLVKDGASFRDQFRTVFYLGGAKTSAAAVLDMPQKDINESLLTTGIAYLRSTSTPEARLVRVPYASNAAIAGLLTDTQPTMDRLGRQAEGSGKASDVIPSGASGRAETTSPEEARIMSLFLAGSGVPDIVQAVFATNSNQGRKYLESRAHVESVIRRALGGI